MSGKKKNSKNCCKTLIALALVLSVVLSAAVFGWLTVPAIALDGDGNAIQSTVLESEPPQEDMQPEEPESAPEDTELPSEPQEETCGESLPEISEIPSEPEKETAAALSIRDTRAQLNAGGTVELDGNYAYVDDLQILDIVDGTQPFDTSDDPSSLDYKDRPGNDEGARNRKVRTFDKVTYTLGYTTKLHAAYEQYQISGGYLWYQFSVQITDDNQCDFDLEDMAWMGTRVKSMSELRNLGNTQNGYVYGDTTNSSGVRRLLIYGKKWLTRQGENPSAIPGAGELNVILNVYNMKNGDRLNVRFYAWLDHNSTSAECETHGITELKRIDDQSVEVTAELRMNVELNKFVYSYCSGAGIFDFSTGNDKALNKDMGEVYGRILGCGITLQIQNDRKDRGLKGCEIPQGEIQLQLDLSTYFCYGKDFGQSVSLAGMNDALVWHYGPNTLYDTYDERDVSEYSLIYCTQVPWNKASDAELNRYNRTTPSIGTSYCYNGGTWNCEQSISNGSNVVTVTVSDYQISPKWFPNHSSGDRKANGVYFNAADGVESTYIGCFSAGAIWLVVPLDGYETLSQQYGTGKMYLNVTEGALAATSISGVPLDKVADNSNQTCMDDDERVYDVPENFPGEYYVKCRYSDGSNLAYRDVNGMTAACDNGQDVASLGQEVGLYWFVAASPYGERNNGVAAAKILIKFDDELLSYNTEKPVKKIDAGFSDPNGQYQFSFLAKEDGTGWNSDAEMNNASVFSYQETDAEGALTGRTGKLRYYATYEELVAAGKICIGILSEYSCASPIVKQTYVSQKAFFHVKDDAKTAKVYQCSVSALVYSKEKADKIGEKMDTLLNLQDASTDVSWLVDDARYAALENNYVKSTYNEETHSYTGGHSSVRGDSVYVTPYRLEFTKTTAQKDVKGEAKAIYDFDRNENVVDFVLSPNVKYYLENDNPDAKTTLTVTDVLPKGLSYQTNSAYLGGTYIPGELNSGNGVTGGRVEGGTPITPVITSLQGGATQLVWTIPDYPLQSVDGQPAPQITYQVTIDQLAANNQQYLNQAMVSSTEDMRAYSAENGNLASYGIQVIKTAAISIAKVYDKERHEIGEELKWTLYVSNNADSGYPKSVFVDTLPYNGDPQGSSFKGALRVTSFHISQSIENMRVFYTTNPAYRNAKTEDITYDGILNNLYGPADTQKNGDWIEVEVADCGCVADLEGKAPVAIAVLGDLPGGIAFNAEISCYPDMETEAGDVFVNTFSRATNVVRSTEYVCGRSLSGLVWLDGNLDGIRSDGEVLLDGLSVELWKLDENGEYQSCGISIPLGEQYDYIAKKPADYEAGSYQFTNLPAGTFAVRFVADGLPLGNYQLSPYQAGDDRTRDSDGTAEGSAALSAVWIKALEMPAPELLGSTEYRSEHNDVGLGVTSYVLPDTGGIGPEVYWLLGGALILAAAALLCLRKKKSA